MAERSEIFSDKPPQVAPTRASSERSLTRHWRNLTEIAVVFALIMIAVWTPQGPVNWSAITLAAVCVLVLAAAGRWGPSALGLTQPLSGATYMLLTGALFCAIITAIGVPFEQVGPGYSLPWSTFWQYGVWSLLQEFILQSIFFLRLEEVFGSRRAVMVGASLFALTHIPSPVLTVFAFLGGLLFCEFFRRWRNLFPLGFIHAALGLTIAASFPDKWLHHMRVGIGYLTMH